MLKGQVGVPGWGAKADHHKARWQRALGRQHLIECNMQQAVGNIHRATAGEL